MLLKVFLGIGEVHSSKLNIKLTIYTERLSKPYVRKIFMPLVGSLSCKVRTCTVGRIQWWKLVVQVYAGEMAHFCHSFALGK